MIRKEHKNVHFVLAIEDETACQTWILDSGASCHLIADERLLYNALDCPGVEGTKEADVTPLHVY